MRRNGARLAAGLRFPVVVSWVFNLGDGGLVFTMLCSFLIHTAAKFEQPFLQYHPLLLRIGSRGKLKPVSSVGADA